MSFNRIETSAGRDGHSLRGVAVQTLGAIGFLLALGACESTVIGLDDEEPPSEGVSFAADIRPLFASSCGGSGCHIGQSTNGVDLSTHASVRASRGVQYGEAVVRPGDAAGSPLVDKIEASPRIGSRMPLAGTPLTVQQIASVRAWIDAGALDN